MQESEKMLGKICILWVCECNAQENIESHTSRAGGCERERSPQENIEKHL